LLLPIAPDPIRRRVLAVSHPAVTCAIPATSQAAHMAQNMGALYGRLPDAELRERMPRHMETL
jgi:aryl-alcohol dehydrogenase-like predicted oxidoreductase